MAEYNPRDYEYGPQGFYHPELQSRLQQAAEEAKNKIPASVEAVTESGIVPGAGGGGQYDPLIQEQIAKIAAGGQDADISEAVQADILGPGYQAAEYGAAAAGVPGAGRVMRGREAVERKAAIQSARMRRQNVQMQHQLMNAYLSQAYQSRKLSSDEAVALAELLSQSSVWAHDAHPALAKAIPEIYKKMAEADTPLEMMHIYVTEAGKATAA